MCNFLHFKVFFAILTFYINILFFKNNLIIKIYVVVIYYYYCYIYIHMNILKKMIIFSYLCFNLLIK